MLGTHNRVRKKKEKIVPLGIEPGTPCTGSEALTIRLQCMTIHDMASVFLTSYLKIESENQNSGFNVSLVSTHSACPYKNYGLKWSQKSQTLHKSFFFSRAVHPK